MQQGFTAVALTHQFPAKFSQASICPDFGVLR
jgi:hypothetical protein